MSDRPQYTPWVPFEDRVPGRLYDADSGVCMGIASDELKARQPAGAVFMRDFCGCPHKTLIHEEPKKEDET